MKASFNTGAKTVFGLVIIAFTAWRTYHLLTFTNPGDPIATGLGLVLFDLGALVWLRLYLKDASGGPQRAVALGGTIADLVLTIVAVVADLIIAGTLIDRPEWIGLGALVTISLATAANVVLLYLYHLASPDVLRENAQRDIDDAHQAADHRIEQETAKEIEKLAPAIAREAAQARGDAWLQQKRQTYGLGAPVRKPVIVDNRTGEQLQPLEAPIASGTNGHKAATAYAVTAPKGPTRGPGSKPTSADAGGSTNGGDGETTE